MTTAESAADRLVGRVTELWRYPVKSMGGEAVERIAVSDSGFEGDRAYGVHDEAGGRVMSAKRWGQLMQAQARWIDGRVEVMLPDGTRLAATAAGTDDHLSEWLDRRVHLVMPQPGARAEFESTNPDDESIVTTFHSAPGWFFDSSSPLHLCTTVSLEELPGDGDRRRFRPNIVVEPVAGEREQLWLGGHLRFGPVEASVRKATVRCVVVTREQPGLDRDREVLRHLARTSDSFFGLYLNPDVPGEMSVGDEVWYSR